MVLHAKVDEFVECYTLVLYSKSTSVYISVKMVRIDISWIVKNLHCKLPRAATIGFFIHCLLHLSFYYST